jgi:vacuolar protein sorting-associated protein IST1
MIINILSFFFFVRTLDEGLAEAISSLLWVAPRLQTDVAELKIIAELLMGKYGRQYADVSVVTFAESS